jgi:serine/threonine-protein kinase
LPTILLPEFADPLQTHPGPTEPTDIGTRAASPARHSPETPPDNLAREGGTHPPVSRGQFTILKRHARGGLGKVSIARDEFLQREVALKEIRSRYADDPHNRERFLDEAMITGRLEHPGIVPVYALGRDERGRPYYAMKFVHGKTLHDAIRDYHASPTLLEFHQLLRHFTNVCHAVGFAHSQGVIHRDLKPANVMLGEYGETLVLDWGLAKRLSRPAGPPDTEAEIQLDRPSVLDSLPDRPDLTAAGQVLGTPAYMSPEQADGDHVRIGPATDIYSLGCILFELLTGRPPFDDLATMDLIERKRSESPPLPSGIKSGVPRPLEAICLKAMDRAPESRYLDALELAREVERWLADERVLAYREPLWDRWMRWARQHKPLVAATAVLLVVAAVALAISNAFIRREQKQTEQAWEHAVEERNRALERFQIANDTLDRMLKRMGHNRLALVAQMDLRSDPARWGLLLDAQRFYQEFVKERGSDPGLRREMALAHRRLGDIQRMKGLHAEAQAAYQRAITLLDQIPDEAPYTDWRQPDLAECHHDLGLLFYLTDRPDEAERHYRAGLACHARLADAEAPGVLPERQLAAARLHHQLALLLRDTARLTEARAQFQQAGEIRERLGERDPENHEISRTIAQTHIDHAHLLASLNENMEAEKLGRRAVELLTKLVTDLETRRDEHADLVEYRHELAGSLNNLGYVLARGKPKEAEEAYQKSLALRRQLVVGFRTRPDFRYELAFCRLNLGVLFFDTMRASQAEPEWQYARETFERLVTDFGDVPLYASRLGQVLNNLAALRDERSDLAGARELLESALLQQRKAWQSNRRHPEYRSLMRDHLAGLTDVLLRLGLHAEAAKAAGEMPEIAPESGAEHRRAAGVLVRCVKVVRESKTTDAAGRELAALDYVTRAIPLLRAAAERGFADPADLRQAPDLEPIRSHPEFLKFLEALEKPGGR